MNVAPSAYELKNLDSYLKTVFPDKIKLEPELTSSKCKMTTKLFIDFSQKFIFAKLLGFDPAVYKPGIHTSQNKINISDINTINIECDLVQGDFYNGIKDIENILKKRKITHQKIYDGEIKTRIMQYL